LQQQSAPIQNQPNQLNSLLPNTHLYQSAIVPAGQPAVNTPTPLDLQQLQPLIAQIIQQTLQQQIVQPQLLQQSMQPQHYP
jgi:hypothetical protein